MTPYSSTWLRQALQGTIRVPYGDPSATLLEQLISFYNRGTLDDRDRFDVALVTVLEGYRQRDVESDALSTILLLVSHAKPLGAPRVLQKILLGRELPRSPGGKGRSLEALAVLTQAEYGIPEWLVEFLIRRSTEGNSVPILLAALQVLPLDENAPVELPLVKLCAAVQPGESQTRLVRAAFTALRRPGMARWFRALSGETMSRLLEAGEGRGKVLSAFAAAADMIGGEDPWHPALGSLLASLTGQSPVPFLDQAAASHESKDVLTAAVDAVNTASQLLGQGPSVVVVAAPHRDETDSDLPGRSAPKEVLLVDQEKDRLAQIPVRGDVDLTTAAPTPGFPEEEKVRESILALLSEVSAAAMPEVPA